MTVPVSYPRGMWDESDEFDCHPTPSTYQQEKRESTKTYEAIQRENTEGQFAASFPGQGEVGLGMALCGPQDGAIRIEIFLRGEIPDQVGNRCAYQAIC